MRIKFYPNYELPLNETLEIPAMTIVSGAVFHENNKYYPQFFLNNCLIVCMKYKMDSKDKLKEIDIKNHACYYFDDIINCIGINFSIILLIEKLYKNISFYDFSYKTSTVPKPLRIRFDKIDGFTMVRGETGRGVGILDI